jgi:hypothetical protein
MSRRLLIALALLAGVFGIGALVYSLLFTSEEVPETKGVRSVTEAPPPILRADASPRLESVVVSSITGRLERKTPQGEWQAVFVGDAVSKDDALRTTGDGASAVLEIGRNGTTIELAGEFTVPTLTTELSTVEVVDGTIAARVVPSDESTLRVEARGSDAVAEAKDGDFSVLSIGNGNVAVASRRGIVAVSAAGETVAVEAGTQTMVSNHGPPSPPKTIPASLLLKVSKTARQLRVRETTVRGMTTPGSIVSIGGVRVQANAQGEFHTKVALAEGRNQLKVVVEDALGRRLGEDLPPFHVDSKAPKTQTGVEW